MASLTVLQFKIYDQQKKGQLPKKDANFFINTIESLITHDTVTLEQALDNMYEKIHDFSDFKEHLKFITVSDDNKFMFDYVDNFNPEHFEVYVAIDLIREELLENTKTR